jgi:hypothetical protein
MLMCTGVGCKECGKPLYNIPFTTLEEFSKNLANPKEGICIECDTKGTKLSDKSPCCLPRALCDRCEHIKVCEVKFLSALFCGLKPKVRKKLGPKLIDGANA